MSEAIIAATAIGKLTKHQLAHILEASGISLAKERDIYELSALLCTAESVRSRMRLATAETIAQVTAIHDSEQLDAQPGYELALGMLLAYEQANTIQLFHEAAEIVDAYRAGNDCTDVAPNAPLSEVSVQPVTGFGVLELLVSTAEIIRQLATAPAKRLGTGSLSGPNAKHLSTILGCNTEQVKALHGLTTKANLTATNERNMICATVDGKRWLAADVFTQWSQLADAAKSMVTPPIWRETFQHTAPAYATVKAQLMARFPMIGTAHEATVKKITALGQLLGLVTHGGETFTELAHNYRDGSLEQALSSPLTATVDYVYMQEDRTIIAPGRLSASLEDQVRTMAVVEQIGAANTYRITPQSLANAFTLGQNTEQVSEFLTEISRGHLPQSVSYLISEVYETYDTIRVLAAETQGPTPRKPTMITCQDEATCAILIRDPNLSILGLQRVSDTTLATSLSADVTFASLAQARYPVVRESADGRLIPETEATYIEHAADTSRATLQIASEILSHAQSTNETGHDVSRILEIAVRDRTEVKVTVNMPDGSQTEFRLLPNDVGNGRLRAKDLRVDVERTLPVHLIESVTPTS